MTPEDRRRFGATAALIVGLFVAISLLPNPPTGPVGRALGSFLISTLGLGALGLPLLGLGVAMAGFNRLPGLDMKRVAYLVAGLCLLVPYFVGVVTRITPDAFDSLAGVPELSAQATGLVPGFLAWGVAKVVAQVGAFLVGFLALSGLTLWTVRWHPLRRLEKGDEDGESTPPKAGRAGRAKKEAPQSHSPVGVFNASDHGEGDEAEEEEEGEEEVEGEEFEEVGRPDDGTSARPRESRPASRDVSLEATELPPLDLLIPPPEQDEAADQAQLDRLGELLIEALRTFKVEGTIAGRTSGPVVTQFEVVPAPGVKVGKIIALSDDLAIKMRTPSVRVAPIPGKGAVGVEVPNPTARIVTIRELLESKEWERSRATLPVLLGRDLEGRPVIADLTKTPHLLIAGATGSGKSVAINTIITGLVYRYSPVDLRFLMIDPKMVELSMYNALPHMRHPVVTDNKDATFVLKYAVREMGRRYELLHANGARNIGDFNRKVREGVELKHPAAPPVTLTTISNEAPDTPPPVPMPEKYTDGILPYLVLVVDELADLMMTVQGEVERPLAILAQKARAIGIHLVLATQRPSVNVITGLIKANFPSRIAFRVASKVDSRTILDGNGAEALLGNGDMLFLPPGKSEPMRLQGAYIATEETERLMDWYEALREKQKVETEVEEPNILEMIKAEEAAEDGGVGPGAGGGDRDPLFRRAAEVCLQNQGGSTSLLQRKLSIGYGKAARIIDQLEEAGILGPPDGSKPREVLVGFGQLDEYLG
jgi:S-DNA-T family DNA segregation ATPase FtsK/SpoIIIE